jgi:hypothetical protein
MPRNNVPLPASSWLYNNTANFTKPMERLKFVNIAENAFIQLTR